MYYLLLKRQKRIEREMAKAMLPPPTHWAAEDGDLPDSGGRQRSISFARPKRARSSTVCSNADAISPARLSSSVGDGGSLLLSRYHCPVEESFSSSTNSSSGTSRSSSRSRRESPLPDGDVAGVGHHNSLQRERLRGLFKKASSSPSRTRASRGSIKQITTLQLDNLSNSMHLFGATSSSTEQLSPDEIMDAIECSLLKLNIAFVRKHRYFFKCFHDERNSFKIEVCLIKNLGCYVVRCRRFKGDIWAMKNICQMVLAELKLDPSSSSKDKASDTE